MKILRHSLEIKGDIDKIFDYCAGYESYASRLHVHRNTKLLHENDNEQLIQIDVTINGQPVSWNVHRLIDRHSYTIFYEHINPAPFLNYMRGAWRSYSLTAGRVLISVEHLYEIKENLRGLVKGIETSQDAVNHIQKTISNNCSKHFADIKQLI